MSAPVRIGVIGTGAMARLMMPSLLAEPGLDVVAVASRDAGRASAFATEHGLAGHGDEAKLLADPRIDAVYIVNATADHATSSIAALQAGKAVLCEKPFATDPDEAARVIAAAEAAQRPFLEAISTPFLPAIDHMLAEARSGRIGTLTQFSADFGYPASREALPRLFGGPGAGVLLDRAVYPLALALLALGPVARTQASVRREDGVDVHAAILLDHEGGGLSQLTASLTTLLGNSAILSGTSGSISVAPPLLKAESLHIHVTSAFGVDTPDRGIKAKLAAMPAMRRAKNLAGSLKAKHYPYGASPYAPELAHFVAMVRGRQLESPVLPHATSLAIQRVLAECR
ncbi:oxidoreductase [Sphingomonas sp. DBB INV C78]|uniref:Gfo/Idh/MocA family protein n=1 Tax=Sphingomonas sp. DBB INV C78 TaxID=3349434 RepID=UPI0036D3FBF3